MVPPTYPILSYSLAIDKPFRAELWMAYAMNKRCLRLDTWKSSVATERVVNVKSSHQTGGINHRFGTEESLYAYEDTNYCGYQGSQTSTLHFVENTLDNGNIDLTGFRKPLERLIQKLATRQPLYFPYVSYDFPRLQTLGGMRNPSLWLHKLILKQFPYECLRNLCQVTGLDICTLPLNMRKQVILAAI
jgi:hypothetical protein